MRTAIALAVTILLAIWTLTNAKAGEFRVGEKPRPELCRGWIDKTCSCTHRSCWEASPEEFDDLNDGRWLERSSGTIKRQTGWSKDGVFIACAWKAGEGDIQYHVGKGNPISCIFPPVKGF
jgi:hypothetical protein